MRRGFVLSVAFEVELPSMLDSSNKYTRLRLLRFHRALRDHLDQVLHPFSSLLIISIFDDAVRRLMDGRKKAVLLEHRSLYEHYSLASSCVRLRGLSRRYRRYLYLSALLRLY